MWWDREQHSGLSHDRPCCYCQHAAHVLRCDVEVDPVKAPGVLCPCRDVPLPGS